MYGYICALTFCFYNVAKYNKNSEEIMLISKNDHKHKVKVFWKRMGNAYLYLFYGTYIVFIFG